MTTLEARIAEALEEHRIDDDYECPCGCDVLDDVPTKLTTHEMRIAHQAEVIARIIREREAEAFDEGRQWIAEQMGDVNEDTPDPNPYRRSNDE